jgi:DNA-directed RNA polymerase subunit M/transcription elongation factor TFIIS
MEESPPPDISYVNSAKPDAFDPLMSKHYSKPYNRYRRAKLIIFSSVLKHHAEFRAMPIAARFDIVEKLERSCYNGTIDKAKECNIPTKWENELFQDVYTMICAKISSNIDQTGNVKNPYLTSAILVGEIDIAALPKMSSQDLYPAKYRAVLDHIAASKSVTRTVKTSAMYKCRRCHKNECTIDNRYNRSLDEGVNLSITCVSCGFEWNG